MRNSNMRFLLYILIAVPAVGLSFHLFKASGMSPFIAKLEEIRWSLLGVGFAAGCTCAVIVLKLVPLMQTKPTGSNEPVASSPPPQSCDIPIVIEELRHVDGFKRWEVYYEGMHLVLLNERAPLPWRSEMLAFDSATCRLAWKLSPPGKPENDAIVGVAIHNGQLRAFSWSGFSHHLDHKTGQVLDRVFTK